MAALSTLRLPPTTDQDAGYGIGANYGAGVLGTGLTFGDHEAGMCAHPLAFDVSSCLDLLLRGWSGRFGYYLGHKLTATSDQRRGYS